MKRRTADEVKAWTDEKRGSAHWISDPKEGIGTQLLQIFVVTDDKGVAQLSKQSQARKFASRAKKDFAYAAMMAYMRFKIWMSSGHEELSLSDADSALCGGDRTSPV